LFDVHQGANGDISPFFWPFQWWIFLLLTNNGEIGKDFQISGIWMDPGSNFLIHAQKES